MDLHIYDEIRKSVDIVDVIGSYIALNKKGKNYFGLCPFHNDSDPSLCVSPEKQIFTCWSCGKTGNVFTFVRDYENISFNEAVKKVCRISGIKVPSELERINYNSADDKYARLYSLVKDITDFYSYQIVSQTSQVALEYLKSRNLEKIVTDKFKIGYCPESGFESITFLKNKGYSDDEIISSGIGIEIGQGKITDRLRGRLIFPLFNSDGKPVAFSGRRINDSMGEKYVNSPETVIFHKTNNLYNYHNAIINSKKLGYCYIVEGFMDAIALTKGGIENVVATMGTAFTPEHIKLLKQLHCQIRLLFDSDNPGQIATNRCIDLLKNHGLDIKVVRPFTDVKDSDEVLNKFGKDSLTIRLNDLIDVNDYKIEYFAKNTNFSNHDDTKRFINDCVEYLNSIELDDIDKEYYAKEISNLAKTTVNLILNKLNKKKTTIEFDNSQFNKPYEQVIETLNKYDFADHQILKMMMTSSLDIMKFISMHLDLTSKPARMLANMIIDRYNHGLSTDAISLLDSATPEVAVLIGKIEKEIFPPSKIEELAKVITDEYLEKLNKDDLIDQIQNSSSLEEQTKLAQELINKKFKKH